MLANGSGEVPLQVELKTIYGTIIWVILAWPICTESAEDPKKGPFLPIASAPPADSVVKWITRVRRNGRQNL